MYYVPSNITHTDTHPTYTSNNRKKSKSGAFNPTKSTFKSPSPNTFFSLSTLSPFYFLWCVIIIQQQRNKTGQANNKVHFVTNNTCRPNLANGALWMNITSVCILENWTGSSSLSLTLNCSKLHWYNRIFFNSSSQLHFFSFILFSPLIQWSFILLYLSLFLCWFFVFSLSLPLSLSFSQSYKTGKNMWDTTIDDCGHTL